MAERIAESQRPQPGPLREPGSPRPLEADGQNLAGILWGAQRDIGSLAPASILTLQRTIGNRAVTRLMAGYRTLQPKPTTGAPDDSEPVSLPPIEVAGTPKEVSVEGGCDGLSLHGQTDANFDGGTGKVANQVVSKGTCDCGKGAQCFHVTGTLITKYSVSVTITMPPMPGGLTPCEQGKVQDFLNNVLAPHEQDHKTRFMTYNGQTSNPVDVTGCSQEDVQSKVQAIQDAEETTRQAAARASSASIDPFTRTVDCSDCKKPAAPSDAGTGTKPDAGNS